jgi:uncharacterized protein (DUF849 family)
MSMGMRGELPLIMVAPTGARRTKADHPQLPMTLDEIVETAIACHKVGAGAIHAHIRTADGRHSLDADGYAALLSALSARVPSIQVQISTEAVGIYSAAEQMALVHKLTPARVSIALREILPAGADEAAAAFYHWCDKAGVSVQHILYEPAELTDLIDLQHRGMLPATTLSAIFVLGRYAENQESDPAELDGFLQIMNKGVKNIDWMVCAFGRNETSALVKTLRAGGKVRVGFENSLWHADGRLAASNAERVAAIKAEADRLGLQS